VRISRTLRLQLSKLIFLIITFLLSSCGGGGGGIATAISVAETVAGIYTGVSDQGVISYFASIGDGVTYSIDLSADTLTSAALAAAPNVASNAFVAANANIINFGSQSSTTSSIAGTINSPNSITTVNHTTGNSVNYTLNTNFNSTASLTSIVGNYTGWGITKTTAAQTYTVTVNGSGAFTESIPGCSLSGNFNTVPGYNYYSVTAIFNGLGCALGNGTTTSGIAFLDLTGHLVALASNSSKTDGFFFYGTPTGAAGSATASFPVQSAIKNYNQSSPIIRFNVTGGCLGYFYATQAAPVSTIFNGTAGFSVFRTLNQYLYNCTPASVIETDYSYYDSNYIPLGFSIASDTATPAAPFGIYLTPATIPVTVHVGDSGNIGTLTLYTDASKITLAGTRTQTYSVAAETTTTCLFSLTIKNYDTNNNLTFTEIDTYRISTAGQALLLKMTVTYSNGLTLNMY